MALLKVDYVAFELDKSHSAQDGAVSVLQLTETIILKETYSTNQQINLPAGKLVSIQNNFEIVKLLQKCKDLVLHETLLPPNDVHPLSDLQLLCAPGIVRCSRFVVLDICLLLSPAQQNMRTQ